MKQFCEYGCGRESKYQLSSGKSCCSSHYMKCPELIARITSNAVKKSADMKKKETIFYKEEYLKNPKVCLKCHKELLYEKRKNKFCSSVCSGSYNTKGRVLSEEQKLKTSKTLKRKHSTGEIITTERQRKPVPRLFCNIYYNNCKICGKIIVNRYSGGKITCSRECHSIASTKIRTYPNGARKTIYYDNPNQGRIVLESSWELEIAKLLDSMKIIWIRPKFIRWVDDLGKARIYYPDFYLSDFQVYLDPKNPFCCNQDFEKMTKITEKIHVIWGDIAIIKYYVENLLQKTE